MDPVVTKREHRVGACIVTKSKHRVVRWFVSLLLVASLGTARADPFPSRSGESGLLDVPDAEAIGLGGGMFMGELRLDHAPGSPSAAGPSPVALVTGLGHGLEIGFFGREGGQPGDPRPSPVLLGGTLKLHLLDADGYRPALAADAVFDRVNLKGVGFARVIASTRRIHGVRLAAYGGVETAGLYSGAAMPIGGAALGVMSSSRTEIVFEAFTRDQAPMLGTGVRWSTTAQLGLTVGLDWIPRDGVVRASLGIAIVSPPPPPRQRAIAEERPKEEEQKKPEEKPGAPVFTDERPRFRLRIPSVHVPEDGGRHLQYVPEAASPTDRKERE